MKKLNVMMATLLALGISTSTLTAHEEAPDREGRRPRAERDRGDRAERPERGEHADRGERPLRPRIASLDKNKDHILDADELADAPAKVRELDRNNDGKVTRDELPKPGRPGGPRPELREGKKEGHPHRDGDKPRKLGRKEHDEKGPRKGPRHHPRQDRDQE